MLNVFMRWRISGALLSLFGSDGALAWFFMVGSWVFSPSGVELIQDWFDARVDR